MLGTYINLYHVNWAQIEYYHIKQSTRQIRSLIEPPYCVHMTPKTYM